MSGPEVARTTFSAAHAVYIPICVLVGLFIGWLLGARSTRAEIARLRGLLEAAEDQASRERQARLRKPEP